jgi:hypothetical protein
MFTLIGTLCQSGISSAPPLSWRCFDDVKSVRDRAGCRPRYPQSIGNPDFFAAQARPALATRCHTEGTCRGSLPPQAGDGPAARSRLWDRRRCEVARCKRTRGLDHAELARGFLAAIPGRVELAQQWASTATLKRQTADGSRVGIVGDHVPGPWALADMAHLSRKADRSAASEVFARGHQQQADHEHCASGCWL